MIAAAVNGAGAGPDAAGESPGAASGEEGAPRACPACEGTAATPLPAYSTERWKLATCDACGFVYLSNPPGYEALVEEFAWEKTYAEKAKKGGSTPLSRPIRKFREAIGVAGKSKGALYLKWFGAGKVIDIGCGDGDRLPPPITPFGIELSKELWRRSDAAMRARGGYCLHAAGAEGIWEFEPGAYDGVLMHSYLEHETEVLKVLEGANRCLRPGGKLFVRVPNYASLNRRVVGARWCGFRHPDHVNYFTLASLRRVAARTGFAVRLVNRLSLPVNDNINALLIKAPAA